MSHMRHGVIPRSMLNITWFAEHALHLQTGREGAALALFDRDPAGLQRVADELASDGVRVTANAFDVREYEAFELAISSTERELGGVDFIVNVADGGTRQTLNTLSPTDWQAVIDLNDRRHAAGVASRKGRRVCVSRRRGTRLPGGGHGRRARRFRFDGSLGRIAERAHRSDRGEGDGDED